MEWRAQKVAVGSAAEWCAIGLIFAFVSGRHDLLSAQAPFVFGLAVDGLCVFEGGSASAI